METVLGSIQRWEDHRSTVDFSLLRTNANRLCKNQDTKPVRNSHLPGPKGVGLVKRGAVWLSVVKGDCLWTGADGVGHSFREAWRWFRGLSVVLFIL